MLILAAALVLAPSGSELPPRIASWKSDLERAGRKVAVARVYSDPARNGLTLPHNTDSRPVFVELLSNPSFVEQFVDMHALTVHFDDPARKGSYVLVNMGRQNEFARFEEALLAHELAHIDLHFRGYRAPGVARGEMCEAIQAGDVVQHILIRDELKRRSIDYVPFLIWTLEPTLTKLQRGVGNPRDTTPCRRMARLTLWMDVWMGLPASLWPRQGQFLAEMARAAPELIQPAWGLYSYLRQRDVSNIEHYQAAIAFALTTMRRLRAPTPINTSR